MEAMAGPPAEEVYSGRPGKEGMGKRSGCSWGLKVGDWYLEAAASEEKSMPMPMPMPMPMRDTRSKKKGEEEGEGEGGTV